MTTQLRLDLLQLTLAKTVADVMPADALVVWTSQTPNRVEGPIVTLQLLSGPMPVTRQGVSESTKMLPDNATITVTAATDGATYYARLNGIDYTTAGVAGDTVTTIRNRLANAMQDDEGGTEPYVSAIDTGADQIVLTPNTPGDLWDLAINGAMTATTGTAATYKLSNVSRRVAVTIQVYARDTAPRLGASFHMSNILAAFEQSTVAQAFLARGIAVWSKGNPIPINALAGTTTWESRSALDVDFVLRSVTATPITPIDNVTTNHEGSIIVGGPVIQRTLTIP